METSEKLIECYDLINEWASYVPEYYRSKWSLKIDLAKIKKWIEEEKKKEADVLADNMAIIKSFER